MALGDKGLMDLTLQEGYKKLLVSEATSGIEAGMNKISTSVATNIAGSVLYMGVDNQDSVSLKIKSYADSKPFFYIESGGGTDMTASNFPLLTAYSAASGAKSGIIKTHNILNIDSSVTTTEGQAGDGMGQGQICFGALVSTPGSVDGITQTWTGSLGSIFAQSADVMHRMTGEGTTAWWKFDRLYIANTVDSANIAFRCDASEAVFAGLKTSGTMKSESAFVATGATSGIQSSNDVNIRGAKDTAGSSINILDTPNINIEARYDTGTAILNLNAVSPTSSPQPSIINIGITDQGGAAPYSDDYDRELTYNGSTWDTTPATLQGPAVINLGQPSPHNEIDATDDNRQVLNIQSGTVQFGAKTSVVWPVVAHDSVAGWEPWGIQTLTEENTIYFKQAAVATDISMHWYDGTNDEEREIDSVHHTSGREMYFSERTIAQSAPTANEDAVIYVKGKKLIVKFDDGGTMTWKCLDLTGSNVDWTSVTVEP